MVVNHTLERVCINVFPLLGFEILEHIPQHKMKGFASLKGIGLQNAVDGIRLGSDNRIIILCLFRLALSLLWSFCGIQGKLVSFCHPSASVKGAGQKLGTDLAAGASGSGSQFRAGTSRDQQRLTFGCGVGSQGTLDWRCQTSPKLAIWH